MTGGGVRRVLVDHGAYHNLGDAAMLEAVVARLLRRDPRCRVHVFDKPSRQTEVWDWPNVIRVPDTVANPLLGPARRLLAGRGLWRLAPAGVATCHRLAHLAPGKWMARQAAALAEEFDALHVVGGGNLTDLFPQEVWQRCCLLEAFAAQGKPAVLTGQQLGPFRSRLVRRSVARRLRTAAFVGVREPTASLRFCARAGLPPDSYALMGDDSFGLPPAGAASVAALLARHDLQPGRFLAVNLRVGRYARSGAAHRRRYADLVTRLARRYDLPLLVVPVALAAADSDVTSGEALRADAGAAVRVLDGVGLTAALVKGVLGAAVAAVGTSYHFCTFALSQGVPAVAVCDGAYYAQKAAGLAAFWQDDRLALPMNDLPPDAAAAQAAAVLEDDVLRQQLAARAARARARWEELFELSTGATQSRRAA